MKSLGTNKHYFEDMQGVDMIDVLIAIAISAAFVYVLITGILK